MKKLILATAIAITGFSLGNAQFMESLQIGVKGGYNYSDLSFPNNIDIPKNGLHGFHLGLFVEVPIKDKLSVQSEIVYSKQGISILNEESEQTVSIKTEGHIKLDYLNVPIIFKYYVMDGLSIDLGPQIGFFIDGEAWSKTTKKITTENSELVTTQEDSIPKIEDYIKSIDFGLGLGVTYKIKAVEGLAISARYNLGLSDISKDKVKNNCGNSNNIDCEDYTSILSSKNRVIQVGLSYQL